MDLARASSNLSAKRGAAVGVAKIARLAATAAGQEEVHWGGGGGAAAWKRVCCSNGLGCTAGSNHSSTYRAFAFTLSESDLQRKYFQEPNTTSTHTRPTCALSDG
jgi:hypothetical protein